MKLRLVPWAFQDKLVWALIALFVLTNLVVSIFTYITLT